MKKGNKSFEIHTSKEYFTNLVCDSYDEYLEHLTSSKYAIICAIFTWHLHEWVWAQYQNVLKNKLGVRTFREFKNFLFASCEEFRIISAIANGSKHFNSDNNEIQSTKLEHGLPIGLTLLFTTSQLIVETDSGKIFFSLALNACINFWEKLFNEIPQEYS